MRKKIDERLNLLRRLTVVVPEPIRGVPQWLKRLRKRQGKTKSKNSHPRSLATENIENRLDKALSPATKEDPGVDDDYEGRCKRPLVTLAELDWELDEYMGRRDILPKFDQCLPLVTAVNVVNTMVKRKLGLRVFSSYCSKCKADITAYRIDYKGKSWGIGCPIHDPTPPFLFVLEDGLELHVIKYNPTEWTGIIRSVI